MQSPLGWRQARVLWSQKELCVTRAPGGPPGAVIPSEDGVRIDWLPSRCVERPLPLASGRQFGALACEVSYERFCWRGHSLKYSERSLSDLEIYR